MSWYNIYIYLFPKRLVPQKYLGFYWAIHRWFGGTPFVFFRLRKAPWGFSKTWAEIPDAGSCLDRITTFLGVLLDDFQHLSPFQILGTRSLGVFFLGKSGNSNHLKHLKHLHQSDEDWNLMFNGVWVKLEDLTESWLKRWWQGKMSRPQLPTRKGYGVLPEQKWILRILNASQTQQMSVFHFHQPFLKIFLGEPTRPSPFHPFPPDEHLETPDEPQHLPEADAVFTGKAHFLGHLLDFLLRGSQISRSW